MRKTLPPFRSLIVELPLCDQNRSIMQGVTRHVFTLRADMARLRRFIDSYLNFVDDDMPPPFYFQPVAPFVTFELIYYPYLTVASRNLISYPQREMAFSIPIECYANEDGVLVFKQYAICIPFLYVDEELSVVSGRDLFGLPKVALKFEDLIDQIRPDSPRQIGRLTLRVPGPTGDVYAPFIEVYRDPPRYVSVRQTPTDLINVLPDAIRGYSAFAADAWEAFARPPIRGYNNQRDLQSMLGMLRANADMLSAGLPIFPFMRQAPQFAQSSADEQLGSMSADIISLKQARDAEHPELVSYQSLVRSTMYLDRLNDGGLLFGPLASDPSSDITIKIHHLQGQPLVESLGLLTEDTTAVGGSGRSVGAGGRRSDASRDAGPLVSTLKPVFPYWLNVDLAYGLGINLYWRGRNTQWSSTDDPGPPSDGNRYLTFGSGALQEDASYIVSPDSLLWVLELPLDDDGPEQLNRLCSKYLKSDCYEFRFARDRSPSVWMFIRNMDNTGEGGGTDIEQEVEFAVIVEWFDKRKGDTGGPPLGYALMPLFVLTDNQTAVFTESEVYGRPTVRAKFDFDSDSWVTMPPRSVMNVSTLLMPELYSGGAPDNRSLVKVKVNFSGFLGVPDPKSRIDHVLRFPSVALKQIVDCRLPDRADFQAIVFRVLEIQPITEEELERRMGKRRKVPSPVIEEEAFLVREVEVSAAQESIREVAAGAAQTSIRELAAGGATASPIRLDPTKWSVTISRYQSVPLVHKAGLKVDSREPGDYTTDEVIQPSHVWALPASIEELGALNLAWRLGNSPWMSHVDPLAELDKISPGISESAQQMPRNFADFLSKVAVFSSTSRDDTSRSNPQGFPEEGER
jgi:hypothetical protein